MPQERVDAIQFHRDAIIIDLVCPLVANERLVSECVTGGLTAVGPTVATYEDCDAAMGAIGAWYERLRRQDAKLLHVTRADDIPRAKREGKLGIIFHFQNGQPFGQDENLVEVYYRLGLRASQLTYNTKNYIGDGCDEATDAGLSEFGKRVVREMNRVGMVVDVAHVGYRTSMEAIELSEAPVIASHSNARAVHDTPRNLRDDQIRALARTGGVVGLNGYPSFVSGSAWPTLDELLRHADHIAELVGTDHLSLGLDYWDQQWPFGSDGQVTAAYERAIRKGWYRPGTYGPPPYKYAKGIEVPSKLENLTRALLARGYGEADVRKILGGNLLRVFEQVWR